MGADAEGVEQLLDVRPLQGRFFILYLPRVTLRSTPGFNVSRRWRQENRIT